MSHPLNLKRWKLKKLDRETTTTEDIVDLLNEMQFTFTGTEEAFQEKFMFSTHMWEQVKI